MSALDSQEFRLAEALIHYINAEPDHEYGICYWLVHLYEEFEGEEPINAYPLFRALMRRGLIERAWPSCAYISWKESCTPARVAAAREVVRWLEEGRITFGRDGLWRIDGEVCV